MHLNILELLAVKHFILAIKKEKTINAIYIQTDNTTALSYLLKMGSTTEKTFLDLNRDIWKYLILKQITITAEYLFFFFFYLGFLSRTFTNHRTAGKGEGISLTPHYHFHPLHRHLVLAGRLLQRAHLCT